MNAVTRTAGHTCTGRGRATAAAPAAVARYVVQVGNAPCEVRARAIELIADVLGFEEQMDQGLAETGDGPVADAVIVDLLDSRMIAPPRPRRRGRRPVSSRAIFFGVGG